MKSLFEQMGGTYTQQGDYFLPDLVYSDAQKAPIRRNGNHHSGRWKSLHSDQIYAA